MSRSVHFEDRDGFPMLKRERPAPRQQAVIVDGNWYAVPPGWKPTDMLPPGYRLADDRRPSIDTTTGSDDGPMQFADDPRIVLSADRGQSSPASPNALMPLREAVKLVPGLIGRVSIVRQGHSRERFVYRSEVEALMPRRIPPDHHLTSQGAGAKIAAHIQQATDARQHAFKNAQQARATNSAKRRAATASRRKGT
jgi:hypothetical protein